MNCITTYNAHLKIKIFLILFSDHNGANDRMFMMTGYNDTDADSATTHLITGGFKGIEHPEECLKFWYAIGVSIAHQNSYQL